MTKFLVKYKTSHQISIDDWAVCFNEALFEENTTLKEIREWYKTKQGSDVKKLDEVILSEVNLIAQKDTN